MTFHAYLGRLSSDTALDMHASGVSAKDIAARAGVLPATVTAWRRRRGLTRAYRPTGLSTADRRTYQREWKRQRGRGAA